MKGLTIFFLNGHFRRFYIVGLLPDLTTEFHSTVRIQDKDSHKAA
jgi:hypothetical protein